jgi:HKD family nuclease
LTDGDWDLVPGPRVHSPAQAIEKFWQGSQSVTAAVAFVTSGGVRELTGLVGQDLTRLELTARAAPVTEPRALLELEAAGARVHVLAGMRASRFHPKLWLGHAGERLLVLSGSANLTVPALSQNKEQMELLTVAANSEAAKEHTDRFSQLTDGRLSLTDLKSTPYWDRWEAQQTELVRLSREQEQLADELYRSPGLPDPRHMALREALLRNLQETKNARIPVEGGRTWVPQRTINQVNEADDAELVPMLARIIKETKLGFSRLVEHGRDELLFERLILEENQPFHTLFSEDMKQAARQRLKDYKLE